MTRILSDEARVRLATWGRRASRVTELIDPMRQAREGGAAERALLVVGLVGRVLSAAMPQITARQLLASEGFEKVQTTNASTLRSILQAAGVPVRYLRPPETDGATVVVDGAHAEVYGDRIAFIIDGSYVGGVWLSRSRFPTNVNDPRSEDDATRWFADAAWGDHDGLFVGVRGRDWNGDLTLSPLPRAGIALGSPDPWDLAKRMKARGGGGLLLIGPSGSGKTSIARSVAHKLGDGRVLAFSRRAVVASSVSDMAELVSWLRPACVVMEDIQEHARPLLEALEGLGASYVILTYMDDDPKRGSAEPGSLYIPGLRPGGRVDEIVYVSAPDAAKRREVLLHYLAIFCEPGDHAWPLDDLVEATEGLTGAYLREVARRVSWDPDRWVEEVAHVVSCAPFGADSPEEPAGVEGMRADAEAPA